ncbi:MAG: hypothetical protein IPG06_05715 [Haliea sp.]|nr:hypothetical protein [Haliea sp.]
MGVSAFFTLGTQVGFIVECNLLNSLPFLTLARKLRGASHFKHPIQISGTLTDATGDGVAIGLGSLPAIAQATIEGIGD